MTKQIKFAYTIWLDSGTEAWAWIKDADDETMYVGRCVGNYYDWYGEYAIPIELMKDFNQWMLEFERSRLYSEEMAAKFNWNDFHDRGLALAKRLKNELGDMASVRYVKPTEDPAFNREEGLEIDSDLTVLRIRRLWWTPI